VQTLIEDYDLIDDAELLTHPEYDAQTVKALKLIQGALRLSAHILIQDTKQLAWQLSGRLLHFDAPEIQELLQQIPQTKIICLRPLTASLTPPGGALVRTLSGHSDSVYAVAVTPDGKYVISGSDDSTLKVWNWQAGQEVRTLAGHSDCVLAVAITPDGKYVISASMDKIIKVWNWQTGEEVRTLTSHNHWVFALAVTPDGKYLISGSTDKTIKVWNIETGEILYTLKGHWREVRAVAVTPDGKKVISGSIDNTLKVWNLKTGRLLFTLRGHSHWITSVAVTPDGKKVISGSRDNTLKVWNLDKKIGFFTYIRNLIAKRQIFKLAGDNHWSIRYFILICNLITRRQLFTLTNHQDIIWAVTVTPNSKQIISGSWDKTIRVWNLETGNELFTLTGHDQSLMDVVVTPDGKQVISASSDKTIKVWNLENAESNFTSTEGYNVNTAHIKSIKKIAITPDGKLAISCGEDGLKFWNLQTREKLYSYNRHYLNNLAVTFNRKLVISSWGQLEVYNFEKRENFNIQGINIFEYYSAIAVTPNGKQAISNCMHRTIVFWNLKKQNKFLQKHYLLIHIIIFMIIFPLILIKNLINLGRQNGVNSIAVTPDGKWVISGSSDKKIKVWSLYKWEGFFKLLQNLIPAKQMFTLTGHGDRVNALAVTPDSNRLISGSNDKTIKVWSLETAKELFTLIGHTDWVNDVAVTPNGKCVISASSDHTLKVWDLKTQKIIASFTGESSINCCAVAPDGVTIVAGEASGRLHFLRLEGIEA
jgi:WD40 repeat protein